jgi:hypothetical protein
MSFISGINSARISRCISRPAPDASCPQRQEAHWLDVYRYHYLMMARFNDGTPGDIMILNNLNLDSTNFWEY